MERDEAGDGVHACMVCVCVCSGEGSVCGVSGTVEVCDELVWYPLIVKCLEWEADRSLLEGMHV